MNNAWLTWQLVRGQPVRAGALSVTPYARVLSLRWPGRAAGLVWMRPGPLEVRRDRGAAQWVDVRDVTREAMWALAALCAAAGVWWWLNRRLAR